MRRWLLLTFVGLVGVNAPVAGGSLPGGQVGAPALSSIDVMRFSPEGLLLLGDARGSQVVVVEVGELPRTIWNTTRFEKINEKLANKIGVPHEMVELKGLAVEPRSGVAFINLRANTVKTPIVLTMTGDGQISDFSLARVTYRAFPLPREKTENVSRITDLAMADGRILVGAVSAAEFGSRVFCIPLQDNRSGLGFSIETFHVSHNRWETRAPMTALMPYADPQGKQYVVGAFGCTPVVRYPLEDVQPGAKVKGESVIELGSGNQPRTMFVYSKDGKDYVLMNTYRFHHERSPFGWSPYWTAKIDMALLAEQKQLNEKAYRRLAAENKANPRVVMVEEYLGVMMMDKLDASRALAVRKEKDDSLTLLPLPLP